MLRNILVISSSGLVIFSKLFVNAVSKPRLVGSLMIAMLEFSTQTTGLRLSYLELNNVGITIVGCDSAKLFCVVIHDRADGEDFGKLISSEILMDFLETFPPEKFPAGGGHNLNIFRDFHFKIAGVVRQTPQPILEQLNSCPAISLALIVEADTVTHATGSVDELGVTANLQALLGISKEVLSRHGDSVESITLEAAPTRSSRLIIRKIRNATLIVQTSRRYKISTYKSTLERAVALLYRVSLLNEQICKR